MSKILLAEDDLELTSVICNYLELESYIVDAVADGAAALERLLAIDYDAVILDWQLPSMTGIEVCQSFRANGGRTPILILTGKQAIKDKEAGLDSGADDYLTKPFHPRELTARLRAMIRRASQFQSNLIVCGPLTLDRDRHLVFSNGEMVNLQPMEFLLLEHFMTHENKVFSAEALLASLWDESADASLDAIYTCIRRLRKKLDKPGADSIIRTVHGVGYGINPRFQG